MIVRDFTGRITGTDPNSVAIADQLKELIRAINGNLDRANIAQMQSLGEIALHSLYFSIPNTPMGSWRIITGRVDSNGTALTGTGFTSVRNALGSYTVTFTVAFASIISALVCGNNASAYIASVSAFSTSALSAIFVTGGGVDADTAFSFLAIGVP